MFLGIDLPKGEGHFMRVESERRLTSAQSPGTFANPRSEEIHSITEEKIPPSKLQLFCHGIKVS